MTSSNTPWLDLAWRDQGTAEIAGPSANESILGYFREVGRGDVTSDEVSWCAAFVGACLSRAGIALTIPTEERLLARSFLKQGTAIDAPRTGCIAVLWRGSPHASTGHVAFVVGQTDTHLALLGGNQADKVCVEHFPRDRVLGYRWPGAPVTAPDLAAKGSRIATGAAQIKRDAGVLAIAEIAPQALPADAPHLGLSDLAQGATETKAALETLEAFAAYAWSHGGWIGAGIVLFYGLSMAWRAGWIGHWRAQDANTGKTA